MRALKSCEKEECVIYWFIEARDCMFVGNNY